MSHHMHTETIRQTTQTSSPISLVTQHGGMPSKRSTCDNIDAVDPASDTAAPLCSTNACTPIAPDAQLATAQALLPFKPPLLKHTASAPHGRNGIRGSGGVTEPLPASLSVHSVARFGAPLLCDLADRVTRLACAQETETLLVNVWQTLESPGFMLQFMLSASQRQGMHVS